MTSNTLRVRSAAIFFLFSLLFLTIIIRLYYIQIIYRDFYTNLGHVQQTATVIQAAPRAPIFDRNGNYLAMNCDHTSAFIFPDHIEQKELLGPFLKQEFPEAHRRLSSNKDKQFMYIKRNLSPEQIKIIESAHLKDIHLLKEPGRFYPIPFTGTIVGMTGANNNGLFGVELLYNSSLSGIPTKYRLEKDARSKYFYLNKTTIDPGQDGSTLHLTIDGDLQFIVHEELQTTLNAFQARQATAIIMNPDTGEIITMAMLPQFDPNARDSLIMEQTKNRIVTESYELGSVIKIFAALAALEEGVVTPDELIDCKNSKSAILDGRKINTWKSDGLISFTDVIARSNNIGIAIVAKRLGTRLYDHYIRVGFGTKTALAFPGQASGFVNPPSNWSKQSIISLSYGYEISATLLQLATAFCIIARNGHIVTPKLIIEHDDNQEMIPTEKLYSDTSIQQIRDILESTTLHGTAQRARIEGYRIITKTGSARGLINGVYDPKKNIYTCTGIVEKGDYTRVIATSVQDIDNESVFAATVAAPLFERIAKRMLIHDRIVE